MGGYSNSTVHYCRKQEIKRGREVQKPGFFISPPSISPFICPWRTGWNIRSLKQNSGKTTNQVMGPVRTRQVQALLRAPGPGVGVGNIAATWPGIGADDVAATWPQYWCRRYCRHPVPGLVQAFLQVTYMQPRW